MPLTHLTAELLALRRLGVGAVRFGWSLAAVTLVRDELVRDMQAVWDEINQQEVDPDEGLVPWEQQLVDPLIADGSSVLVVGSSNGRVLLPLIARGCHVVGVDPSPSALATARHALSQRGMSAELVEGFVEATELMGEFDTVFFAGLGCYAYIPESATRIRALRNVATHLRPGGQVILSYEHMPRPRPWMLRIARATSWMSRSDWRPEPGDYLHLRRVGGSSHFTFQHAFRPDEIEGEAAAAGMQVVLQQEYETARVFSLAPTPS